MNAVTIIEHGHPILWQDAGAIPADRKDGRDMLLWMKPGYPTICSWDGAWCDAVGREVDGVTHWADIQGPGA